MLAVMISNQADIGLILKILLSKALAAIIAGFALDTGIRLYYKLKYPEEYENMGEENNGEVTEEELEACDCGCGDSFCAAEGNLLVSAIIRTLRVFLFIVLLSFIINIILEFFDISGALRSLSDIPVVGSLVAGLIGLIPNCAVSVAVTELFLEGIIGAPFMLTALMASAGS